MNFSLAVYEMFLSGSMAVISSLSNPLRKIYQSLDVAVKALFQL